MSFEEAPASPVAGASSVFRRGHRRRSARAFDGLADELGDEEVEVVALGEGVRGRGQFVRDGLIGRRGRGRWGGELCSEIGEAVGHQVGVGTAVTTVGRRGTSSVMRAPYCRATDGTPRG